MNMKRAQRSPVLACAALNSAVDRVSKCTYVLWKNGSKTTLNDIQKSVKGHPNKST